jgi:hypothetical protein
MKKRRFVLIETFIVNKGRRKMCQPAVFRLRHARKKPFDRFMLSCYFPAVNCKLNLLLSSALLLSCAAVGF